MKRIISAILMAAMLFCFAACTPVSKDSIQPAVYKSEDELYPRLTLRGDDSFSFILNTFATQSYKGTYSVSDRVLKLECTDGSVFCFDIERKSIVFNAELSDEIVKEYDTEIEFSDGTKLEFWREHE